MNKYRAWDPLYGRIELGEFEFGLLSLSEVQRLRYVRMCNINSMLVSGASEISRFEHTLGVLYLARRWCQRNQVPLSVTKEIVAAAILHDMQTGPFGHSMQYVLEDNQLDGSFIHEDLSHGWRSTYHQVVLAGAAFAGKPFSAPAYLGRSWDNVARIIRGEGEYGPLIAGTMDLDNIDNVVRLAYHVGVADRRDRDICLTIADGIKIREGKLFLAKEHVPAIEKWQVIRHKLYELLLLDWAEFAAKAMLTRAIERASAHQLIGSDSWVRTDAELLDHLERAGIGEAQEVRGLVRRLRRGELYEPVLLASSPSIQAYAKLNGIDSKNHLEDALLLATGIRGFKVISHYILDKGKTDRSIAITTEEGETVIGNNSSRLLCGLFVSGLPSATEKASLAGAFTDLLRAAGVAGLVPLNDPMGESPPQQHELL